MTFSIPRKSAALSQAAVPQAAVPQAAVMVQGTASSVGKSVFAAGLCRLFLQEGLRVAPFKAQNMALNSYATAEGDEIGRAQAVQAEAAGIAPSVDMNPILLKPEGSAHSQVIVLGRPWAQMNAVEYQACKPQLRQIVLDALNRLRAAYDVVVVEGAGSAAEINLRRNDIVNMDLALRAQLPVLLVGDIDRGGVFAALVGTLSLMGRRDRERVQGLVINRFRGDAQLLDTGLRYLHARTGVPVLGVLPYLSNLRIAEEDSVALDDPRQHAVAQGDLEIVVIRLPRISNHDDFAPLEYEPNVRLRYAHTPAQVSSAQLLIVPGSKCTVSDLNWLRAQGWAEVLRQRVRAGLPVLGICGGCQMLGRSIHDPLGVESSPGSVSGLGLLPLRTCFGREKRVAQVRASVGTTSFLSAHLSASPNPHSLEGYEIHMGRVYRATPAPAPFLVEVRNGTPTHEEDGAIGCGGSVVGTMLHGLFANAALRKSLLHRLSIRALDSSAPSFTSAASGYDQLASMLREHLDLPRLWNLAQLSTPAPLRQTPK